MAPVALPPLTGTAVLSHFEPDPPLVLLFVLSAGSAFAQTKLAKADVPFDFTVNGKTLTAGNYSIVKSAVNGVIIVRGEDRKGVAASLLVCSRVIDQSLTMGSVEGGWTYGFFRPFNPEVIAIAAIVDA